MSTLPVIFRKDRGGEVTAVFPTEPGTNDLGTMTCYAHIGQHSSCSVDWLRSTKPASPEEYADLLAELKRIYEQGEDAVRLVVRCRVSRAMDEQRRAALRH